MLELFTFMGHKMIIKEKIVNLETGEETIIDRELTVEEIATIEANQAKYEAEKAAAEAREAARKAVLEKLGLSAEDIEALLN